MVIIKQILSSIAHMHKHSLTSVGHTPLYASEEAFPCFPCQSGLCRPQDTGDCNLCRHRPTSCINDMLNVVSRFMEPRMVSYVGFIFTVKPILKASETNDSRHTVIVLHTSNPSFYSVLSGKLSSVYELDSILS